MLFSCKHYDMSTQHNNLYTSPENNFIKKQLHGKEVIIILK